MYGKRIPSYKLSGHFLEWWKTRSTSTTPSFTRYGIRYGVPPTTSSLVPGTRPGLPIAGWAEIAATLSTILDATRFAAAGSSRAMYDASASRFASAVRVHLTRINAPFLQYFFDLPIFCEIPLVGFLQPFFSLANLPFLYVHIGVYGVGHKPRPGSSRGPY